MDNINYDVSTAAKRIGLARQTLNKLRTVGGGPPFYKLGRRVLYSEADLIAWMDQRRKFSTSDVGVAR